MQPRRLLRLRLTSTHERSQPRATLGSTPRTGATSGGKVSRKKNEILVAKGSKDAERAAHALGKKVKKMERKLNPLEDEAMVEISMTDVLTLKPAAPPVLKPSIADDNDSDVNSELDEQEKLDADKAGAKNRKRVGGKGKEKATTAFQQRELVALAFAGDNVVEVNPPTSPLLALTHYSRTGLCGAQTSRNRG